MAYEYRLVRFHGQFGEQGYKEGSGFVDNICVSTMFTDAARAFDLADDEFEKNASWTYAVERI